MDIKQQLGKRIQEFRKSKSLTQEKLAEIIGVDTVSLSKIETGRNYPTPENITKIAKVLNIEVYELFVQDVLKNNEELLQEIQDNISKITNNNQKLHTLNATIKAIINN